MTGRRHQIFALAVVVVLSSLVACSSNGALPSPTQEVFGLVSSCAPLDAVDDQVVVVPGQLVVDQSGQISGIRFLFDESRSNNVVVSEWAVTAGLLAGDLISASEVQVHEGEPISMTPLAELVADAPGEWLLALRIARLEPLLAAFVGVEYDLGGKTYQIRDTFEFEVPCPDQ